jgi:RimJ/RimL family protein N-acetyltransferase
MSLPLAKRTNTGVTPALLPRTDMADTLASPVFAQSLATAIVRYGRGVREPGEDAPLEVFDLAPGQGVLAARLLRALGPVLDEAQVRWRVRLHLCDGERALNPAWQARPLLREALARGEVVRECWNPVRRTGPACRQAVFLAMGYFQQLPVQLGAAHYAQWLDGHIEPHPRGEEGGWPLACRWTRSESGYAGPVRDALQELYRRKLGSAALNLPSGGLRVLRNIERSSHGHYLLLAVDAGAAELSDIVAGALALPTHWRDGVSVMPVNFHALGWAQPRARIAHCRSQCDDPLLQVALAGADTATFQRIVDAVQGGASHALRLREQAAWLAPQTPMAVWLTQLREARFDPRLVQAQPPHDTIPVPLDATARAAWREALEQALCLAQDEPGEDVGMGVGMRAAELGLWDLAMRALQPVAPRLPPRALDCLLLAELHGGEVGTAAGRVVASAVEPDDWRAYLPAYRDECARLPWYDATLARDGELCLEPLALHHAPAWLEQYRDPHIGIMTRLPDMTTLEDVQAWIAEQRADGSRAYFAVVDRAHGFVGGACYQRAGETGYFHFWIGSGQQNRGLGRRAGRLLQGQARRAGLACLYTSAYQDNPRSRAALAALGFMPLAVRALPPDDDFLFFAAPLRPGHVPARDDLARLCRAIDSPLVFESLSARRSGRFRNADKE